MVGVGLFRRAQPQIPRRSAPGNDRFEARALLRKEGKPGPVGPSKNLTLTRALSTGRWRMDRRDKILRSGACRQDTQDFMKEGLSCRLVG